MREYLKEKSNIFSSEHIQNEVLTIKSEHPSYSDHFERKFQAKISSTDKSIEKPEEVLHTVTKFLVEFHAEIKAMNDNIAAMLEKLHDKSDKKTEKQLQPMSLQIIELSSKQSEKIQNEVLTITSEHPYFEDHFERKLQDNISPSDKNLKNKNNN